MSYLANLTIRLAAGLAALDDATRQRHARFLLAAQRDDGGFGGREGGSDLYYTGFGLRGLAILGELHGEVARDAGRFLQSKLNSQETIVDFLSLIYGGALLDVAAGVDIYADAEDDWQTAVAASLEQLRRDDGGYAKGAEGRASSTYHTFLVLLCLELIERPPPEPEKIVSFIHSRAGEEGGFQEIRVSKRAGTNPTAAAIGVLRLLDSVDEETSEATIDFLYDMQNDEGGLRANTRIPIADVLSTFTGMLTLNDLGGLDEIDLAAARGFVESLEQSGGGFHAAVWDQACDVEYTFYGLGCLALLNKPKLD